MNTDKVVARKMTIYTGQALVGGTLMATGTTLYYEEDTRTGRKETVRVELNDPVPMRQEG